MAGVIERRAVGRLDARRFVYTLADRAGSPTPTVWGGLDAQAVRRFAFWAGPATRQEIAWWLGLAQVYPKTHYVMPQEQRDRAIVGIQEELGWWKKELEKQNKFVEAQRVVQRTMFDIEMMRTIGHCHGVENYSRTSAGVCREKRRQHFWIMCRRIICCLWTKRTFRFRKWAVCFMGTDPGSKRAPDHVYSSRSRNL